MAGLIVTSDGVQYADAELVREHIEFLKEEDSETLADLALGLLAELERAKERQ